MYLSNLLARLSLSFSRTGSPETDPDITHITSDSRQADPGALFVCLRGFVRDGHDFASIACQRGCRVLVTDHLLTTLPPDTVQIVVEDTHTAMTVLACRLYRDPSNELNVIGITGTKGKTTSALLIFHVLAKNGISTGYIGTNGIRYGNHQYRTANTTPDSCELQRTLRQMADEGVRYVVMEVSSQALKLRRTEGIRFFSTVFTNFSPDHLGPTEHPDLEDYRRSKARLFSDYATNAVIYNADDDAAQDIISGSPAKKIRFAIDVSGDYTARDIVLAKAPGSLGVSFVVDTPKDRNCRVFLPFPGKVSVYNALCALTVCSHIGLPAEKILSAMADAHIDGRFQLYPLPMGATVVIDYAHNGASLKAALETLRGYRPRRLICVFGSVGGRTQNRRRDMGEVASRLCDLCILTSDNPGKESPEAIIADIAATFGLGSCPHIDIPDREQAIRFALAQAQKDDIILLAGKGHETTQLVGDRACPFCEADIIRNYLLQGVSG